MSIPARRHVAIAIFIDKDDYLYIQERGKVSKIGEKYGLWGGSIEKGETPKQAFLREMQEKLDFAPPEINYWGTHVYQYKHEGVLRTLTQEAFICPLKKPLDKYNIKIQEDEGIVKMHLDDLLENDEILGIDKTLIRKIFKIDKKAIDRQINELKVQDIVPFRINEDDKLKRNYTIHLIPPKKIIERLLEFSSVIKAKFPDHFFYNAKQLHITFLGNIDVNYDQNQLIKNTEELFEGFDLKFKLIGIGSNKHVSSFTAYPVNFSMHELREDMRGMLGQQADDYTIHTSSYEHLGWINYFRYLKHPDKKLLELLRSFTNTEFGNFTAEKIRILKNTSRTLQDSAFEIIYEKKYSKIGPNTRPQKICKKIFGIL